MHSWTLLHVIFCTCQQIQIKPTDDIYIHTGGPKRRSLLNHVALISLYIKPPTVLLLVWVFEETETSYRILKFIRGPLIQI